MKIGIVTVPYFLTARHLEWAQAAMESLSSSHELLRIALVNRHRNDHDKRWLSEAFDVVEYNDRNVLARAWNRGIQLAITAGCQYILVINLDLILHPSCIDVLSDFGERTPDALLWTGTPWHDLSTLKNAVLDPTTGSHAQWSCFMIRPSIVERIGVFDEQFEPAYLEDCDMRYRLHLAGHSEINLKSALFYHLERGTMKGLFDGAASELSEHLETLNSINKGMELSGQKYLKKWGGLPNEETFKSPYNQ